jgi:hypothetical protein
MVAVTKLARMAAQQASSDPARSAAVAGQGRGKPTTYVEREFHLARLTDKALGIGTGEKETWTNQRDGWQEKRERVIWLPRSQVRLVHGTLGEGEVVTLEVPTWLLERSGLA